MVCRDKKTKIHPKNVEDKQFVRINGWMKPLHWLQFVAWSILLLFALIYFGLCAIALENGWKPAAYVCVGVVYAIHIVVHLVAITVNPADDNSKTRIKENHAVPAFDRSRHVHVIENEYCHLCEVHVDTGSKHCRACNKCVAEFDHHCLWLNNCVGKRNYKYFFASIVSALLGIVLMLIVAMYVFIQAIQNFQGLDSGVWWNNVSVSWILFEVAIGIFILLAIIAMFLLGQLLIFHFKLFHLRLTTYEYILKQRDHQEDKVQISTVKLQPLPSHGEPTRSCAASTDYGETTVIDSTELVDFPRHNLMKQKKPTQQQTKEYLIPQKDYLNKAYKNDAENHLRHNDNNSSNEYTRSRSVTPQSRAPSSLGDLEDGLPENNTGANKAIEVKNAKNNTGANKAIEVKNAKADGDKMLAPAAIVKAENEIAPEVKVEKPRRKKRKSSKKSMMKHREDGMPMALPVLHESPNGLRASAGSNVQQGPYPTNRLPPLRSSVDWASSSEDLSSSVVIARKLPPLSNSSSMNSLASYAGSGLEAPIRK